MKNDLLTPSRRRSTAALWFTLFYYGALPVLLVFFGVPRSAQETVYSLIGITVTLALFSPLLRRSFSPLREEPKRFLLALAVVLCAQYIGSTVVAFALEKCGIDPQTANNAAIVKMLKKAPVPILLLSVVIAPITEECLFRGALFATLYKKNRFAAYALSALAFAFVHTAQSISKEPQELFRTLMYVPSGLAFCFAYAYTGSLWANILLHAAINAVAYCNAVMP